VIVWSTIVAVAAFAFASDLTSLATFFGLLAAGLAVALQNLILSAVCYFVLVGRRGIRVGDRVQLSARPRLPWHRRFAVCETGNWHRPHCSRDV
jgi:small-conductance mechanosensitive channel